MNRACLDVRIWGPFVVAAEAVLLRGSTDPGAPATTTARAVELPLLHGLPEPRGDAVYRLDPDRSSVRLRIGADGSERLLACGRCAGRLSIRDGGAARELELECDLAALQPVDPAQPPGAPLPSPEATGARQLAVRATLQHGAATELPGVVRQQWSGSVRLAAREVAPAIELWQVSLPGQPLRLQGHAVLAGATFGPPSRSWLGLAQDSEVVVLGLDLAWRRQRGN